MRQDVGYYHSSLIQKKKEEIKKNFLTNIAGLKKEVEKCAIELQVTK